MPTSPIARQQRAPTVAIGRRRSRQSRSSGWASNLARLLEDSSIKQVSPSVAPGQPIPPPWPLCSRRLPRLALGADCGLGADTGRSGGAKRLESEPQKKEGTVDLAVHQRRAWCHLRGSPQPFGPSTEQDFGGRDHGRSQLSRNGLAERSGELSRSASDPNSAIADSLTGAKMAAQRVARTILCGSDPNEMQHDL